MTQFTRRSINHSMRNTCVCCDPIRVCTDPHIYASRCSTKSARPNTWNHTSSRHYRFGKRTNGSLTPCGNSDNNFIWCRALCQRSTEITLRRENSMSKRATAENAFNNFFTFASGETCGEWKWENVFDSLSELFRITAGHGPSAELRIVDYRVVSAEIDDCIPADFVRDEHEHRLLEDVGWTAADAVWCRSPTGEGRWTVWLAVGWWNTDCLDAGIKDQRRWQTSLKETFVRTNHRLLLDIPKQRRLVQCSDQLSNQDAPANDYVRFPFAVLLLRPGSDCVCQQQPREFLELNFPSSNELSRTTNKLKWNTQNWFFEWRMFKKWWNDW